MQRAAGPNGIDAPRLIILVPAATGIRKNGTGEVVIHMPGERADDVLLRMQRPHILALQLADDMQRVPRGGVEAAERRSVLHRRRRAALHHEVGHVGHGEAEVRARRLIAPQGGERDAVLADDGEARPEGHVEARGADDRVRFAQDAVAADDAVGHDLGDGREVDADVWLLDGVEVAFSRRDASAADGEVRGETYERSPLVVIGDSSFQPSD